MGFAKIFNYEYWLWNSRVFMFVALMAALWDLPFFFGNFMAKIPYTFPHENTQEIAQTISCVLEST